jgi:hypothetical protein
MTFKTSPKINNEVSNAPVFGKVLNTNLAPLKNVLVKISFPEINDRLYYSAYSNNNGEWIITLPYTLTKNYQNLKLASKTRIDYEFWGEKGEQSIVYGYYQNSQPLQSIILGQNYNLLDITTAVLGASQHKFQSGPIIISNPKNNQVLSNLSPLFRGLGPANSALVIEIEPQTERGSIITNEYGEWRYFTQTRLLPGKYYFRIYNPIKKETESSIVSFMIGKSGETVLGEATGSATLTVAPTTAPLPSPTLLVPTVATPTSGPTIVVEQVTVPVSPSPTIAPQIETIAQTGFNNNLFILTASTLSLLGLFLILY